MPRMAMCRCGAPLISTILFSGAEFYCLECGSTYGWFEPDGAEPTPELDARYEALLAEWKEIAPALLTGGVMFTSCDTCSSTSEPHYRHATDEERAAHEAALERLKERKGRAAA